MEGEICSQCCGRDREDIIDCPIECRFLIESRMHADTKAMDPTLYPDLLPREEFIVANQSLFTLTAISLLGAAIKAEGCIDRDLLDCLDAAIRNRRAQKSGLIYDGKPDNCIAAEMLEKFDQRTEAFLSQHAEWYGEKPLPDADLLEMLVFVRMLGGSHENGRRKGRAFLHLLHGIASQQLAD